MIGAIIGDIIGSAYEFNNFRRTDFSPLFHPKARFTDDTVCTIAIADALLNGRSPAESLKDWGQRYWQNGGWGRSFALWLGSDSSEPYSSYGNGAAMRVGPAGFLARSPEETLRLAHHVTAVTHNHPEGLKGAAAISLAIYLARQGIDPKTIRTETETRFRYDLSATVDEIRPTNRFNETCQVTVPQALICALTADSYEGAIRNAVSIGGDSDTIAAIAGSVAESLFRVPDELIIAGWQYLPEDMRGILEQLYKNSV